MRFSRRYEVSSEFRARQGAFDFATAAQAVVEIALAVRKTLGGWWGKVRPVVTGAAVKKAHQLVLELDGLEQIPLFRR